MKKEPLDYPIPKECPYCGSVVIKTTNDKIYGRIFGNGMVYMCTKDTCDSYVGCHDNGVPLGILASKELRDLKKKCHSMFDPIWKTRKLSRTDAYMALAFRMGIKVDECHFGHMDKKMLEKASKAILEMIWEDKDEKRKI